MMYLLDTNVVSDLRKVRTGKADKRVAKWADGVSVSDLFLSAISVQELETGVLLLERRDATQGKILRSWLDEHVLPAFSGRILAVDEVVARRAAALHVPDPLPMHDSLLAASALVHGMTVVTRNVQDFEMTGVMILNPWVQ